MTISHPDLARDVASALLSIKAVSLSPDQPFTWASGLHSPIYCDNRITLSDPRTRGLIAEGLATLVTENFTHVDVVAGTATAGIAHAALAADRLGTPMAYVRSAPKDHGKGNQIEGRIEPGSSVVMVEDLISTGGSVIEAAKAVERLAAPSSVCWRSSPTSWNAATRPLCRPAGRCSPCRTIRPSSRSRRRIRPSRRTSWQPSRPGRRIRRPGRTPTEPVPVIRSTCRWGMCSGSIGGVSRDSPHRVSHQSHQISRPAARDGHRRAHVGASEHGTVHDEHVHLVQFDALLPSWGQGGLLVVGGADALGERCSEDAE